MGAADVWIRGTGPDVEVGRFRPVGSGFMVSWNGADERPEPHAPPGSATVAEGSLRYQALTAPRELAARLRRTPAEVIRELLQEAPARALDAKAIQWHLTKEVGLGSTAVSNALKVALPALREDPHVQYDPVPELPTFRWSATPVAPEPHADLRRRPWRHLAAELPERTLSPEESELLLERGIEEPPQEPHALVMAAALGFADWPAPADVLALASDRRRMLLFTGLGETALLRLRDEARAAGRTDVLWLLAGVPCSSKALQGLAADLEPVDPELQFPAVVIDALVRRQTATVGKPLSLKLVAEILDRIPPCPASGVQHALRDLARTANDRDFRLLVNSRPELSGAPARPAVPPAADPAGPPAAGPGPGATPEPEPEPEPEPAPEPAGPDPAVLVAQLRAERERLASGIAAHDREADELRTRLRAAEERARRDRAAAELLDARLQQLTQPAR